LAGSLRHKAIHGVGWSFIDNIASSGITFLVGLVLARLLTPEEYGIMAMIAIFIAVSNSIIDSGFSSALIRKTRIERIDYNTVFYFNLTVSILIYVLLYIAAPAISVFFKEPVLVEVVRIIGWVLIINALAIIPRTQFVREVDFKTQTKVSLISSVSSGVIGIGMALGGMGVWSLVGQQLSRQFLNTLFLWVYSKWHPVWEFSRKSFNELFGFGSKLLLSGLLDTIYKNIYYIVIGRFYTSAQLGQYTRAEQFNMIFSSNLTSVVQRVSYPVLSSIQEEPERLREGYRKVIKITMLITFACMLGLAAVAKPLILILIGEKWLPAVYFLQIICFSGMLYPLHAINLNILQVKGRSDLFLKLEIIKKIVGVIVLIITIPWGIKVMCGGLVFSSFISLFINSHYTKRVIGMGLSVQMKELLPIILLSFSMGGLVYGVGLLFTSSALQLFVGTTVGIIYYVVVSRIFKQNEVLDLLLSVKNKI